MEKTSRKIWNKGLKGLQPWHNLSGLVGEKRVQYFPTEEHKRKLSERMSKNNPSKKIEMINKRKLTFILKKEKGIRQRFYRGKPLLSKQEKSWQKNKRNRVIKRIRISLGTHTYGNWEMLKKQYNFTCPCCKKSEPTIKLTEDHIVPLSKGGSDLIENIQPLCISCNVKKHTAIIKF